MLVAGHETDAPEVTYPLHQKGWHAIHLGLCSYLHSSTVGMVTKVHVRLKSDPVFYSMTHLAALRGGVHQSRIDEYFWKHAQFERGGSHPAPVAGKSGLGWKIQPAGLDCLHQIGPLVRAERCEACDEGSGAARTPGDCLLAPAVAHCGPIPVSTEWLSSSRFCPRLLGRRIGGPMRLSDQNRDRTFPGTDSKDPYRMADRLSHHKVGNSCARKESTQFLAAVEHAHDVGVEFHTSYRTGRIPLSHRLSTEINSGGLYERHPEWRGMDRHGTRHASLLLRLCRSSPVCGLVTGRDGGVSDRWSVPLLYNRRPPLVEYEAPVVEGFQTKYGEDPRQLDEKDPRWLSYRATFLTQFMREVREAMEKAARDQNRSKPLEVSAIVMSSREENLYYAMDLETWIKEGLVDTIIPYTSAPGLDSSKDSWVNPSDAEFFLRITRDTPCKLALNLMPRSLTAKQYRSRAHALYQAGVEHLFFWDGGRGRGGSDSAWEAMRRLGHREEIEAWVRAGSPEFQRPGSELVKLGDWDLSYNTPG